MEYGGRKHIELLTNILNVLSYEARHSTEPPDRRRLEEASEALHAALLCHTRPVPLPAGYVVLGAVAGTTHDPSRVASN